ncbi:prepilin-type N-terminal cleavage/methylation domain-containing protein [Reinekea marinisedimentorum]|uniref:MSHA pilin protein MshA n=1 Tax=Reinekea marinisedimentorum TaxID=230495 RepID=A0A4R3I9A9_9GAMM|nr:prepilin-type N-terminal cleavage/methylation domain-containing protein [Reinekea marinisedimentorum]TCS41643.1 MSHA pilin protein MshA [Reinekea marinisedimentorum]
MKKQAGFTLIELIMVIVILGILSAFALPRFADLGSEAREATLEGGIAAVRSSAAIAHATALAQDIDYSTGTATVDLDGATGLGLSTGGYPDADSSLTSGIGLAAQLSDDFTIGTPASGVVVIQLQTNCSFEYDESDGSASSEVVSGC